MAKQENLEMKGTVVEALSNATFRIKLDDSKHEIVGHVSGKIRMHNIRILLGDKVVVEISPYDLSKGRITWLVRD
jgi:translation initiation factor IF-1